jgi:hypothetical protein
MIPADDRRVLRDQARQAADVAALPIQQERRKQWIAHSSLESARPVVLVFPEGSWQGLLLGPSLRCADAEARRSELAPCTRATTASTLPATRPSSESGS